MKTFKQFTEQVNTIKPLSPYKVMPMKKKDGSYNQPNGALVDPITDLTWWTAATVKI